MFRTITKNMYRIINWIEGIENADEGLLKEAQSGTGWAYGNTQFHLRRGADVNTKDEDGNTALMLIDWRLKKVAQLLLESGADVNAKNNEGKTALHIACMKCSGEIFSVLLKAGAKVNVRDHNGNTALMFASMDPYGSGIDIRLMQAGAEINAQNKEGKTALHLACEKNIKWSVKHLLVAGADVNIKDNNGNTPLMLASNSLITRLFKTRCIREIRKNARILSSSVYSEEIPTLPLEIWTRIVSKIEDDVFSSKEKFDIACRFFRKPPIKEQEIQEEEKYTTGIGMINSPLWKLK